MTVLCIVTLLAGCGSSSDSFKAILLRDSTEVLIAADNIESKLKSYALTDGTPLFKIVKIEKNNGLFYNSYTFKATTNIADCKGKYTIALTMPGSITQTKDGLVEDGTATFTIENFDQENEIVAYSDSNNITAVIVILVVLVVVLGAFIYFTKRKEY